MNTRQTTATLAIAAAVSLAIAGCGDGDTVEESTPDGASSELTAPTDEAPDKPSDRSNENSIVVNGDSWAIRSIMHCENPGMLDLLVQGEESVNFILEIDEATDDWNARLHGSTVDGEYGTTTFHENVSASFTHTDDLVEGTFVLGHPDADDVTVDVRIPIPAETPNCPAH